MIHLTISNSLILTGLSPEMRAVLKKSLTIPNKDYHKMRAMNVWAPESFKYYSEPQGFLPEHNALKIPRGCLTRLTKWLKAQGAEFTTVDNSVEKPVKTVHKSTLVLRDYQEPVVAQIVASKPREGCLVLSTGFGKTNCALEIINRLGLSATICVPNTVIFDQFISECEKNYGFTPARINAKYKEIGDVTVATFQSLFDNDELLKQLSDNTSILIIDECQGIVSKERRKVLEAFRPKHLFGLSATPSREDSLTPAIFFLCGNPIAEHQMEQAMPEIEIIRTGADIPMSDRYDEIVTAMVENEQRNKLIAGLIFGQCLEKRKTLVFSKRIRQYELFRELLPNLTGAHYIESKDDNRNELLHDLKTGKQDFNVLFGTVALIGTGLDIPAIDTIILAHDLKAASLTVQEIGRALRLLEGKPTPRIIDLVDDGNPILANQGRTRLELYKARGWEIKHYFKCNKCKQTFTYYRKEYLVHNSKCYGQTNVTRSLTR